MKPLKSKIGSLPSTIKNGIKGDQHTWTQLVTSRNSSYETAVALLKKYVPEVYDGGGYDHDDQTYTIFIKHKSPRTIDVVKTMFITEGLSVQGKNFW